METKVEKEAQRKKKDSMAGSGDGDGVSICFICKRKQDAWNSSSSGRHWQELGTWQLPVGGESRIVILAVAFYFGAKSKKRIWRGGDLKQTYSHLALILAFVSAPPLPAAGDMYNDFRLMIWLSIDAWLR